MNTTRTIAIAAPVKESRSAVLADLVDRLTARAQGGEVLDADALGAEFPDFADDLERLLPALGLLGNLSRSREPLGRMPDGAPRELGDYRIVREVGRGGMGVVYEAEQISLNRRVALKVLPIAAVMDPRQLQRFHNEAVAAAGLDHPHVVKVFSVGCERSVHFIAMQFIDGQTLADLIRERRQGPDTLRLVAWAAVSTRSFVLEAEFDPQAVTPTNPCSNTQTDAAYARQVAAWGIQAAEALEHAHALGIVHRDVKPGNLLIDGRSELFVADFGLARLPTDLGVTSTGDLLGTIRYMSPEQARALHGLVDHRSDVYSLGATLYEMIALVPAFGGNDRGDVLRKIADESPASLRTLDPSVPRDLETVVFKCLEKDPARRYQSAKDLAADLSRFLRHEPILAKKPTWVQRAGKWSRRHPAVIRSAALMLVLAAAGSSLSTWLIWQGQLQTEHALAAEKSARRTAEERDAETSAVLDFVERRIMSAARPEGQAGGLGHEVSLRRALDEALPFVETSFVDQPLIEARLRRTMGVSFHYLGEEIIAAQQLEAALALYAKHRGREHPDTLATINNLANSYAAVGRFDDAIKLHIEALAQREVTLGTNDSGTLDTLNNLAISYDARGQHTEALEIRVKVLAQRQATLGRDHPDTFVGMNNLAISYAILGRHEIALKLREETLAFQKARPFPDYPGALAAMTNLAESYHTLGRFGEAHSLYEATLVLAKDKLKEDHPDTLLVMNNLAWSLATAADVKFRDPARAAELAGKAVHLSPKTAAYAGTLGTARYRSRDWNQATVDLQKAIDLRGPDDCRNAGESFFLAMARWQLGDAGAARKSFDMGIVWMDQGQSRSDEVSRFRAEAAELLGIKDVGKRPNPQTLR